MVTKSKISNSGKKKRLKVASLKKETVKDLSRGERKRVKGGGTMGGSGLSWSAKVEPRQ